jgi:hypothetical protein
MNLDDTAAAYGMFQVVFADVTDHLAVATFRLREHREPGLCFETVFKQEFKQILKQFRLELRRFDGRDAVSDSLHVIQEACKIISTLANWRNDRIHARVHMTEHGYALYDWRTRRRLEITREQIERNINLAAKVMAELDAHVPFFVHLLTWDEEIEKLFSTLPELSEAPDNTETD